MAQILSHDHTGFGVWFGDLFHNKDSEQLFATYIERSPPSLEKFSIQDDIATYTTKHGAAHEFYALDFPLNCRITYRTRTNSSRDTTLDTHLDDEVTTIGSPLLPPTSTSATIGATVVGGVGRPHQVHL